MQTDFNADSLINIHFARGEQYAFLSRLFSNTPNKELYQMLADMLPKLKILTEATENVDIVAGTEGIMAFLEKRDSLDGQELIDFDLETARHYTTMFCLINSIPVDESNYTSVEHKTRQKSNEQMRFLFGKYAMAKVKHIPENEDFVGYELLFMSKLAYDCSKQIQEGKIDDYNGLLKAQLDFHTEHFDKWIYSFFNAVEHYEIKDENLYKFFALLSKGFVREDKAILEDLFLVSLSGN